MKKAFKIFLASAIAVGLLAGQAAGAAGLVPDCAGSTCTVCHILLLISNIYSFIVKSVLPPLAGLLFLVGGIMMIASAGSEERYKRGRQVLVNTAIGAVIVLGSWIIVNTLITSFGSNNVQGFNASGWWNPSMTCTAPVNNTVPAANNTNNSQIPACETVGVCTESMCAPGGKCGPLDPWIPNCCSCGYGGKLCPSSP